MELIFVPSSAVVQNTASWAFIESWWLKYKERWFILLTYLDHAFLEVNFGFTSTTFVFQWSKAKQLLEYTLNVIFASFMNFSYLSSI